MITSTEFSATLVTSRWVDWPAEAVIRAIWLARLRVAKRTVSFAVIGVITALLQPSEFRSEARIIPEMNTGANDLFKRLSSMAGFSGVDFSDAEDLDAVRPDLYPNVLQSTPFILFLIDEPITGKAPLKTVGQFLSAGHMSWSWRQLLAFDRLEDTKISPSRMIKGPVHLSVQQQELAEEIGERVNAKLDTRSGVITITAQMPDARIAATVAQLALNYLTKYVTNYRTEKARQDLVFYDKQLADARQRYHKAQLAVFDYNDNHKAVVMQASTIDRHRMEAELIIAQSVYTELSRRFEQAKLNVQERTPIFNVLEPPNVPLKRVSPRRTLIVLVFSLVGLIMSVLAVLFRQANVAGRLKAMITEDTH